MVLQTQQQKVNQMTFDLESLESEIETPSVLKNFRPQQLRLTRPHPALSNANVKWNQWDWRVTQRGHRLRLQIVKPTPGRRSRDLKTRRPYARCTLQGLEDLLLGPWGRLKHDSLVLSMNLCCMYSMLAASPSQSSSRCLSLSLSIYIYISLCARTLKPNLTKRAQLMLDILSRQQEGNMSIWQSWDLLPLNYKAQACLLTPIEAA